LSRWIDGVDLLFFIFQLQEKIGKGEFGDVRLGKREHTFPLFGVTSKVTYVADPDEIRIN
jgi:hypothetical protein